MLEPKTCENWQGRGGGGGGGGSNLQFICAMKSVH